MAVKCLPSSLPPAAVCGSGSCGQQQYAEQHAASADLLREASVLAALRHPNIVTVFGVVLPPHELELLYGSNDGCSSNGGCGSNGSCSSNASSSSDSNCIASLQQRGRPCPAPAVVTEYMAAGSLRHAISSGAEWVQGCMVKVKLLLDTANVSAGGGG